MYNTTQPNNTLTRVQLQQQIATTAARIHAVSNQLQQLTTPFVYNGHSN